MCKNQFTNSTAWLTINVKYPANRKQTGTLMEQMGIETIYPKHRHVPISNPMVRISKFLRKVGENFLLRDRQLVFTFQKPYDALLDSELRTNVLRGRDSNPDK